MAFRTAATTTTTTSMMKGAMGSLGCRWYSHVALPAPLERVMDLKPENPFSWHGEFDREMENNTKIEVPKFSFGGSMELMAVPKKKVSKHKRGIRNGPRALKPIPVIMRCRCCGRVKLPHFFCCSGERGMTGERSDATS